MERFKGFYFDPSEIYKGTNKSFVRFTINSITNNLKIRKYLRDYEKELLNKISEWISQGSGWVIESVKKHIISAMNTNP